MMNDVGITWLLRRGGRWLIVPLWLLSLSSVMAEEFGFVPRATLGIMNYSYESKTDTTNSDINLLLADNDISDSVPVIGIGGMLIHRGFFLDAFYQRSMSEGEGTTNDSRTILYDKIPVVVTVTGSNEFDRVDYALTFGYNLTDNLAIFTGYKNGKTEADLVKNIKSSASDSNTTADFVSDTFGKMNFESGGAFVGANYSLSVGKGTLGFNLAIAKLTGEFNLDVDSKVSLSINKVAVPGNEGTAKAETLVLGSTIGYSLGVKWTAPINERLSYGISLDRYSYSFDKDEAYVTVTQNGATDEVTTRLKGDFDMEESAWSLRAALNYRFDF